MSRNLKAFRDDLLRTLGSDNVILIYHHGSQARGEARSDSDYDTILILNEIDEKVLQKTRDARAIICALITHWKIVL